MIYCIWRLFRSGQALDVIVLKWLVSVTDPRVHIGLLKSFWKMSTEVYRVMVAELKKVT